MAVKTYSFRYKPTTSPSGAEDRVLACSHTTDACHCVINSSGQIGYYVSGSFTQMGTKTISIDNVFHSVIIEKDDLGNGAIYIEGQKIGTAINFPTDNINQIGNFKTELKPEVGRKPKVGLKPRPISNIYTRPCCGEIDEIAYFDRQLSASEIVDLSQSGSLSKVYTLADYKITVMADDGIIATTEKPRYLENWRSIWDADQRTSALPTAIGLITVNGSYKSLANSANGSGIWTPTTSGTAAYDYYQAVESWRQMYFVSSGGGTGFLLTSQLGVDTNISAMSQTLETRQSALMYAEDNLRSAVMTRRQTLAETNASNEMTAYVDDLEAALRLQTDHAIVFTTSATDPSTGWSAQEKLIHKGDYWRTSTTASWYTWSGTAWGIVNDAAASAAATAAASAASVADGKAVTADGKAVTADGKAVAAQATADKKTTLWATLSTANSSGAVIGDMFIDNGFLYRCGVTAPNITVGNSYRLSAKNWGALSEAPTDVIIGDRYYNTTNTTWYIYTSTGWVVDGQSIRDVTVAYAPKYLGRYLASHPSSYNNGDWWLVYDTDDSPIIRGFWYSNNGSPARVATLGSESQQKYKSSGLEDVLWASNNGYALLSGVYNPVSVYGVSTMEFLAVNQAFIEKLMVQELTLKSTGKIKSENFVSGTSGFQLQASDGSAEFNDVIMRGKVTSQEALFTKDYELPGMTVWQEDITDVSINMSTETASAIATKLDALLNSAQAKQMFDYNDNDGTFSGKMYVCVISSSDVSNTVIISNSNIFGEFTSHICQYVMRYTDSSGVIKYVIGTDLSSEYSGFVGNYERLLLTYSGGSYTKYTHLVASNKLIIKTRVSAVEVYGNIYSDGYVQSRCGIKLNRRGVGGYTNVTLKSRHDVFDLVYRIRNGNIDVGTAPILAYYNMPTLWSDIAFLSLNSPTQAAITWLTRSNPQTFNKDDMAPIDNTYIFI